MAPSNARVLCAWLSAAALWIALAPGAAPARGRALPESASRVAVVDLYRVLSESRPFVEEQARLKAWIDAQKRTNLDVKKAEIEAKEAELELFQEESEPRRQLALELDFARLRYDREYQHLEKERGQRITEVQKSAFAEAARAVADYARENGIEVVLQLRSGPLEGATQAEVSSEIYLRDVLYAEASLDITEALIRILDAKR